MIELNEWLQEESLVQDQMKNAATKWFPESSYRGKQNSVRSSRDQPKNSAFTNDRELTFQKCPIDDGEHLLWECDKFQKVSITEKSEAVKQAKLCFECLTGKHRARDCKSKLKCRIDGCERNHNRLLHNRQTVTHELIQSPDQTSETNLTNETAWSVKGLLQVALLRIYAEDGSFVETKAVCDTASSQTWIDEDLIQSLRLEGRNTSMSVTGIHGTNSIDCLKVPVKIGPADEVGYTIKVIASSYKDLVVGTSVYNVIELIKRYLHLLCIRMKKIDLNEVKVILGQDAYSLIRPLEYKYCGNDYPWAVKVPLVWTLSGPLPNSERTKQR